MKDKNLVHLIHYSCDDKRYILRLVCTSDAELKSVINSLISSGFIINYIEAIYE